MGKWLIKLGQWLNTRFPEKVSVDAFMEVLGAHGGDIASLQAQVNTLEQKLAEYDSLKVKIEVLTSDMNKAKGVLMATRIPTQHTLQR